MTADPGGYPPSTAHLAASNRNCASAGGRSNT